MELKILGERRDKVLVTIRKVSANLAKSIFVDLVRFENYYKLNSF